MLVGGRLFLFLILIWSSSLLLNIKGDFIKTKERRKRHIFPLLGYLHGYKIGQNFALQLPPFVLSPLIIVPVNQQQSINIQKSGTDESFQENGSTFQSNFPAKLILNSSLEDIETNIKILSQNCTLQKDVSDVNDTFRQINEETKGSTGTISERDGSTSTTDSLKNETEHFSTIKPETTAMISGFYPDSVYTNDRINSLQFTTSSTEANLNFTTIAEELPDIIFKKNNTRFEISDIENTENKSVSSQVVILQPTTERYYVRPNTRYYNPHSFWHNAMVDQLSITTNSYREDEKESPLPPWYDDRWRRFSSLSKVVLPASGFKPLAGLYYDGFLHKSLTKKTGFIPFDKYYYD